MPEEILCLSCRHRRVACVPEPSCVTDPTNRKRFHWRERWRQMKEERRAKENEIVDRNRHLPLGGEPWFHAWCEPKSKEASQGSETPLYVLAEHAYAVLHAGCPLYDRAAEPAVPSAGAAPRASEPSGGEPKANVGWASGRSF